MLGTLKWLTLDTVINWYNLIYRCIQCKYNSSLRTMVEELLLHIFDLCLYLVCLKMFFSLILKQIACTVFSVLALPVFS